MKPCSAALDIREGLNDRVRAEARSPPCESLAILQSFHEDTFCYVKDRGPLIRATDAPLKDARYILNQMMEVLRQQSNKTLRQALIGVRDFLLLHSEN